MIDEIHQNFEANLARAEKLIEIYEEHAGSGPGRRGVTESDLLRAAVVFLHASLEDLLRSTISWKLPEIDDVSIIDNVPLLGISDFNRPQKFFLGSLIEFKKLTVKELIEKSVSAHFYTVSFNSMSDIVNSLKGIGLDPERFSDGFGILDGLVSRRHHIVHQADLNRTPGTGHHAARSISKDQVREWLDVVRSFGEQLLGDL